MAAIYAWKFTNKALPRRTYFFNALYTLIDISWLISNYFGIRSSENVIHQIDYRDSDFIQFLLIKISHWTVSIDNIFSCVQLNWIFNICDLFELPLPGSWPKYHFFQAIYIQSKKDVKCRGRYNSDKELEYIPGILETSYYRVRNEIFWYSM